MPASHPTIAVLGTLTRDTTTYADGTCTENLGGLVYSLSTLAALGAGQLHILPVANVGDDLYDRVIAALDWPGIDPSVLRRVPQSNNHVHLTYRDAQNREEVLEGLVPPVELEHALAARRAAWYLVNLTSGRDLTLATLQGLRAQWKGTLQLDIHSLTLDILPGGRRALRCPPDWQDWVRCVDWVQVNETEALLLGEGTECAAFARALLELGPQGAIVTLGERGCLAAWRTAGRIEVGEWPAATHPAVPFPTGCGDVFGATFAYAMLQGGDPGRAVELANGVASTKACYEPQAAIAALRDHAAPHLQRFARPLD